VATIRIAPRLALMSNAFALALIILIIALAAIMSPLAF
jgi:hypothetical protein